VTTRLVGGFDARGGFLFGVLAVTHGYGAGVMNDGAAPASPEASTALPQSGTNATPSAQSSAKAKP
jgi:hypothetical protein